MAIFSSPEETVCAPHFTNAERSRVRGTRVPVVPASIGYIWHKSSASFNQPTISTPAKSSRPTFVGVGFQKTGSSSVARFLRKSGAQFPHRARRSIKELHWFEPLREDSSRREERYAQNFSARGVSGEFTPGYIEHPQALASLRKAAPKAKIIVFLRDPVARLISAVSHARGIGKIDPDWGAERIVDQAFQAEGDNWVARGLRRGTYLADIENLYRVFPERQVFVGFFDDWIAPAPRSEPLRSQLLEFVGLSPEDATDLGVQKVNTAAHQLAKKSLTPLEFDTTTLNRLRDYYSSYSCGLVSLLGRVTW